MPRVTSVKRARKGFTAGDGVKVKKGDPYYWWKFRFGGKHTSTTYPKRSQLTRSGFLSQLYGIQDSLGAIEAGDGMESEVGDITTEIGDLRDECQGSLDNMPEHLQESSSSGELLQERVDAMDEWISELEGIDYSVDEELDEDEKQTRYEEILEEIQNCEPQCG